MKSEGRNPKAEGNPKSEIRTRSLGFREFGFRISFGFRPSDFGFRNNMSLDLRPGHLGATEHSGRSPACQHKDRENQPVVSMPVADGREMIANHDKDDWNNKKGIVF